MRPRQSGHSTMSNRRAEIINGPSRHRTPRRAAPPGGPTCSRARAREPRPRGTHIRQGRAARRSSAFARAGASPGGTNTAVSVVSTSRSAGRSDATMGRPICRYSNSFSGDVNRSENRRCRVGQDEHRRFRQGGRHVRRRQEPGDLETIGDADLARELLDARAIGLARMTADDQSTNARRERRAPARRRPHPSTDRGGPHRRRSGVVDRSASSDGHGIDRTGAVRDDKDLRRARRSEPSDRRQARA